MLYLDVGPAVRGPTCVWEEVAAATDDELVGMNGDPRAGAPRALSALHVIPAVANRLLRFDGASLHSVAGPTCNLLGTPPPACSEEDAAAGATGAATVKQRRATLLFNTWWCEPPGLPSPDDPAPPKAVASLAALDCELQCKPVAEWEMAARAAIFSGHPDEMAQIEAPLLGDATRRGCEAAVLSARVASAALASALDAEAAVHTLELSPCDSLAQSAPASSRPTGAPAEVLVDKEEELAMRVGYAAHLESEFWGADDGEQEEFFYDEDEDEDEDGGVFWAKLAAMQATIDPNTPPSPDSD